MKRREIEAEYEDGDEGSEAKTLTLSLGVAVFAFYLIVVVGGLFWTKRVVAKTQRSFLSLTLVSILRFTA